MVCFLDLLSPLQLPILCKEFIIDAYQIFKARMVGADAVLLIAAVLPDVDLIYMSKIAKSMGMATLIEVSYSAAFFLVREV